MTQEMRLLQQIGEVDEQYVAFAQGACPASVRRHSAALRWIAVAACLAVLLAGCACLASVYLPPKEPQNYQDEFVSYDPLRTAQITYDGRTYSFYQIVTPRVLAVGKSIGEGVCTQGDGSSDTIVLYAVKGMDPSFMVTAAYGHVYMCDNDITLHTGADIFEQRLRLKEHYRQIVQRGYRNYELADIVIGEQYHGEFETFLDALCEGNCLPLEDVTSMWEDYKEEERAKNTFWVMLDNGLRVTVTMYDGGYVRFCGLDVAVKMDASAFEKFRALLKELKGSPWKTVTYPDWDAIKAEREKKEQEKKEDEVLLPELSSSFVEPFSTNAITIL